MKNIVNIVEIRGCIMEDFFLKVLKVLIEVKVPPILVYETIYENDSINNC